MDIKKAFLIYNSGAGKNKSKVKAQKLTLELEKRGVKVVGFESNSRETDQKFASMLEKNEGNVVICLGGDGTLGAVVRTLCENKIDLPIAVLPCGTANDFATAGKIPKNVKKFVNFLFENTPVETDVAKVEGTSNLCEESTKNDGNNSENGAETENKQSAQVSQTYVINAVGSGNFSNGVTVYSSRAKRILGKFGYYIKCVAEFFRMKSCVLDFDCDGEKFSADTLMYYFVNAERAGGFNHFAPVAKINDGKFDLVVVKKCGFFSCLKLFAQIVFGKHLKNKNIITREISIAKVSGGENHPKFFRCDIDGNKGPAGTLNVEVIKGGAKIFVRQDK